MIASVEQLLPVCLDDKWGYINVRSETVVQCQFDSASSFSEGLAAVCVRYDREKYENHEIMVVSEQLHEIGRFACAYLGQYSEGLMYFELDEKYGFVDRSLKVVIAPTFSNALDFADGLATVEVTRWGRWGMIDRHGQWAIRPDYDSLWSFKKGESVTAFSRDNKYWGLLNRRGQIVVTPRFRSLGWPNKGDLAAGVEIDNRIKKGIINEEGEWLVNPCLDDCDGGFTNDLMAAAIGDNWGIINRRGDWVVDPQFTNARKFSDGLCGVYVGGKRDSDYCLVGGKYGFIDASGEVVIEPRFDEVFDFQSGICGVELIDGDPDDNVTKRGYIDNQGRYIWEPTR